MDNPLSNEINASCYDLAKHLPSLYQTVTIATDCGQLQFEGNDARQIAGIVKTILERRINGLSGVES